MIEKYAFITNENYYLYAVNEWPYAISVGDNYKMVQFAYIEEQQLTDFVLSIGFECQHIQGDEIIEGMENLKRGPFVCDYQDASMVVHHFNPRTEIDNAQ